MTGSPGARLLAKRGIVNWSAAADIDELLRAPKVVYVLEGWLGDVEWREGIYADREHAEQRCTELNAARDSDNVPHPWIKGLAKFAVEPVEVIA
jgi:hypothetical protein